VPEGSQAALGEATLVAAERAGGTAEGAGDIVLVGPSLVDQADHGVGFGHAVGHRILSDHDSGDHHHALALLGSIQAAIVDNTGAIWITNLGK
jgi:hypothetical protein